MESKILDKINKLLKLAQSPNIEEASSAMEKAHQLLKEHNLLNEICTFNYCKVMLSKTFVDYRKNSSSKFVLYGREENIAATKVMYEYLVSAIDRISHESRKYDYFNVNDFKNGAVRNIAHRLHMLRIKENNEEKALI